MTNCINCGRWVNAATNLDDPLARPVPGDYSICLYCGHLMMFADDLSLRAPTDDEMQEIAGNPEYLAYQRGRV